jgi:hypothetical protein
MLDVFIIEEIKRREREREQDDRPVIELPLPVPNHPAQSNEDEEPSDRTPDRGVIIIDYSI